MQTHQLITMRMPAFAAFCLLVLTTIGYAQSPGRDNILVKSGQKVVFMGDSITGMGWGDSGGYIHLVVAGLNSLDVKIVPIPSGVGGNTSISMLARLKTDALDKKPDWLLLSCGVNDVWGRRVSLDTFKKNITSIVDQAQAAGIKVVLLTSTVIGEDLTNDNNQKLVAYNDFLHQLAKDRHLPIAEESDAMQAAIKASPPSSGNKFLLTVDGVHPNPDGHQIMATALLQSIGATPAQIDSVKQAWLDLPSSAYVIGAISFRGMGPITIRQFNALKILADAKHLTIENFCHDLYFQALVESCAALQSGSASTGNIQGQVETQTQAKFAEKIVALTK